MSNASTEVKEWYLATYPTDELGEELNGEITFMDLFIALDNYRDVYDLLGVHDSIVRERVFGELAKIMKVQYDYIYQQWLKG